MFNERLAVVNRFMQGPKKYDCYVFGSSRTTMLNAQKLDAGNCFNFSFSAGMIGEFLAYAEYLKEQGYKPEKVLIGVDLYNFFAPVVEVSVPEFIKNKEPPTGVLRNYLSLDTLWMSLRTLFRPSHMWRFYREDFSADIYSHAPSYWPNHQLVITRDMVYNKAYNPAVIDWYKKMLDVFEGADIRFYVPPIGGWRSFQMEEQGNLDNYLESLHAVAHLGVPLYDFSSPHELTFDYAATYDGSHFNAKVNEHVLAALNEESQAFGWRVDQMTLDTYKSRFRSSMEQWREKYASDHSSH